MNLFSKKSKSENPIESSKNDDLKNRFKKLKEDDDKISNSIPIYVIQSLEDGIKEYEDNLNVKNESYQYPKYWHLYETLEYNRMGLCKYSSNNGRDYIKVDFDIHFIEEDATFELKRVNVRVCTSTSRNDISRDLPINIFKEIAYKYYILEKIRQRENRLLKSKKGFTDMITVLGGDQLKRDIILEKIIGENNEDKS